MIQNDSTLTNNDSYSTRDIEPNFTNVQSLIQDQERNGIMDHHQPESSTHQLKKVNQIINEPMNFNELSSMITSTTEISTEKDRSIAKEEPPLNSELNYASSFNQNSIKLNYSSSMIIPKKTLYNSKHVSQLNPISSSFSSTTSNKLEEDEERSILRPISLEHLSLPPLDHAIGRRKGEDTFSYRNSLSSVSTAGTTTTTAYTSSRPFSFNSLKKHNSISSRASSLTNYTFSKQSIKNIISNSMIGGNTTLTSPKMLFSSLKKIRPSSFSSIHSVEPSSSTPHPPPLSAPSSPFLSPPVQSLNRTSGKDDPGQETIKNLPPDHSRKKGELTEKMPKDQDQDQDQNQIHMTNYNREDSNTDDVHRNAQNHINNRNRIDNGNPSNENKKDLPLSSSIPTIPHTNASPSSPPATPTFHSYPFQYPYQYYLFYFFDKMLLRNEREKEYSYQMVQVDRSLLLPLVLEFYLQLLLYTFTRFPQLQDRCNESMLGRLLIHFHQHQLKKLKNLLPRRPYKPRSNNTNVLGNTMDDIHIRVQGASPINKFHPLYKGEFHRVYLRLRKTREKNHFKGKEEEEEAEEENLDRKVWVNMTIFSRIQCYSHKRQQKQSTLPIKGWIKKGRRKGLKRMYETQQVTPKSPLLKRTLLATNQVRSILPFQALPLKPSQNGLTTTPLSSSSSSSLPSSPSSFSSFLSPPLINDTVFEPSPSQNANLIQSSYEIPLAHNSVILSDPLLSWSDMNTTSGNADNNKKEAKPSLVQSVFLPKTEKVHRKSQMSSSPPLNMDSFLSYYYGQYQQPSAQASPITFQPKEDFETINLSKNKEEYSSIQSDINEERESEKGANKTEEEKENETIISIENEFHSSATSSHQILPFKENEKFGTSQQREKKTKPGLFKHQDSMKYYHFQNGKHYNKKRFRNQLSHDIREKEENDSSSHKSIPTIISPSNKITKEVEKSFLTPKNRHSPRISGEGNQVKVKNSSPGPLLPLSSTLSFSTTNANAPTTTFTTLATVTTIMTTTTPTKMNITNTNIPTNSSTLMDPTTTNVTTMTMTKTTGSSTPDLPERLDSQGLVQKILKKEEKGEKPETIESGLWSSTSSPTPSSTHRPSIQTTPLGLGRTTSPNHLTPPPPPLHSSHNGLPSLPELSPISPLWTPRFSQPNLGPDSPSSSPSSLSSWESVQPKSKIFKNCGVTKEAVLAMEAKYQQSKQKKEDHHIISNFYRFLVQESAAKKKFHSLTKKRKKGEKLEVTGTPISYDIISDPIPQNFDHYQGRREVIKEEEVEDEIEKEKDKERKKTKERIDGAEEEEEEEEEESNYSSFFSHGSTSFYDEVNKLSSDSESDLSILEIGKEERENNPRNLFVGKKDPQEFRIIDDNFSSISSIHRSGHQSTQSSFFSYQELELNQVISTSNPTPPPSSSTPFQNVDLMKEKKAEEEEEEEEEKEKEKEKEKEPKNKEEDNEKNPNNLNHHYLPRTISLTRLKEYHDQHQPNPTSSHPHPLEEFKSSKLNRKGSLTVRTLNPEPEKKKKNGRSSSISTMNSTLTLPNYFQPSQKKVTHKPSFTSSIFSFHSHTDSISSGKKATKKIALSLHHLIGKKNSSRSSSSNDHEKKEESKKNLKNKGKEELEPNELRKENEKVNFTVHNKNNKINIDPNDNSNNDPINKNTINPYSQVKRRSTLTEISRSPLYKNESSIVGKSPHSSKYTLPMLKKQQSLTSLIYQQYSSTSHPLPPPYASNYYSSRLSKTAASPHYLKKSYSSQVLLNTNPSSSSLSIGGHSLMPLDEKDSKISYSPSLLSFSFISSSSFSSLENEEEEKRVKEEDQTTIPTVKTTNTTLNTTIPPKDSASFITSSSVVTAEAKKKGETSPSRTSMATLDTPSTIMTNVTTTPISSSSSSITSKKLLRPKPSTEMIKIQSSSASTITSSSHTKSKSPTASSTSPPTKSHHNKKLNFRRMKSSLQHMKKKVSLDELLPKKRKSFASFHSKTSKNNGNGNGGGYFGEIFSKKKGGLPDINYFEEDLDEMDVATVINTNTSIQSVITEEQDHPTNQEDEKNEFKDEDPLHYSLTTMLPLPSALSPSPPSTPPLSPLTTPTITATTPTPHLNSFYTPSHPLTTDLDSWTWSPIPPSTTPIKINPTTASTPPSTSSSTTKPSKTTTSISTTISASSPSSLTLSQCQLENTDQTETPVLSPHPFIDYKRYSNSRKKKREGVLELIIPEDQEMKWKIMEEDKISERRVHYNDPTTDLNQGSGGLTPWPYQEFTGEGEKEIDRKEKRNNAHNHSIHNPTLGEEHAPMKNNKSSSPTLSFALTSTNPINNNNLLSSTSDKTEMTPMTMAAPLSSTSSPPSPLLSPPKLNRHASMTSSYFNPRRASISSQYSLKSNFSKKSILSLMSAFKLRKNKQNNLSHPTFIEKEMV